VLFGLPSKDTDLKGSESRHLHVPPTLRRRRKSASKHNLYRGVMRSVTRSADIGIGVGSEIRQIESAVAQKQLLPGAGPSDTRTIGIRQPSRNL
jgi:hypothetical protein